jgi:hypothetical protein
MPPLPGAGASRLGNAPAPLGIVRPQHGDQIAPAWGCPDPNGGHTLLDREEVIPWRKVPGVSLGFETKHH